MSEGTPARSWVAVIRRKVFSKKYTISLSDNVNTTLRSDYGELDKIFINKDTQQIIIDIDDVTPVPEAIIVEKIVPRPGEKINILEILRRKLIKLLTKKT